jgi:non-ribosomal peptide synthetase component F
MSPREIFALGHYLGPELQGRTISDARHTVSLSNSLQQASLVGRPEELAARSVLLAVKDQLISAVAMTELDGLARRLLVCPPDISPDRVRTMIEDAEIDAVVTDEPLRWSDIGVYQVAAARLPVRAPARVPAKRKTEWLLLTSDTSGAPKIVGHALEELCGATVAEGPALTSAPVWATFTDIRGTDGLRIFLRAIIGGGSLVLSEPVETMSDYVARLASRGVTHIAGAPSHWRKLLMSGPAAGLAPQYVFLSGDVADPAMFDELKRVFPGASIAHIGGSAEAGAGFAIDDSRDEFPAEGNRNINGCVLTIDAGSAA